MTKTNKHVIDTFAWIEYFKGSALGRKALPFIEGGNGITPMVVLAELSAYYARTRLPLWEQNLQFVETNTFIAELTNHIAKRAGQTRQQLRAEKPKFGLADAIILETAKDLKAFIVSGDPHFKGLPDVIFLEE